ncbi:collagen binding domain-containing protein [Paenibacillus donghaensis]|uniref:Gram-positive cocci surface proteins LPxTG domain-containing protein n=1 Tax=Paenibacillus donghaensis TaxID=414771 RepID=A0A2Z2K9X7_9BACL|nr:collagen binding domain-containing protein [Paenibacillus donghaensis]ASA19660.1 hypothetical protein B9T62_01785 [Paenibacillus donghaensis]
MMKKRLAAILVAVLLITQWSYAWGPLSQATAKEIESNIITSVTMAVYEADKVTVVTDAVYEQGAKVKLNYEWELPYGGEYKSGDTFAFALPAAFELFNDIEGPLIFGDINVGSFVVHQDTHQVVMTFNQFVETHQDIRGTLQLETKFDKATIQGSTIQEILFPIRGGEYKVSLKFKPDVQNLIEKKGVPAGDNAGNLNAEQIKWTVDVNKVVDNVYNAEVTDQIPVGLGKPYDIKVYRAEVNLKGEYTNTTPIQEGTDYTTSVTNETLKVNFTGSPIKDAYRIEYTTDIIDPTHHTTFVNKATFTGKDYTPVSAEATVSVEHGALLNKSTPRHDTATRVTYWEIDYNYGETEIAAADAVLSDYFSDSQELLLDSVEVYEVDFKDSKAGTERAKLTKNTDYTITAPAQFNSNELQTESFQLDFKNDITKAYKIKYQTRTLDRVEGEVKLKNTVYTGTEHKSVGRDLNQVILKKSWSNADYNKHTVDWKISLNEDSHVMNDVEITDSFPTGGLKFIPGSLQIRDKNNNLLSAASYELVYTKPLVENNGFVIKFKVPVTGPLTVGYQTEFNNDWLESNGTAYNWVTGDAKFTNKAELDWVDPAEPSVTKHLTAEATFNPDEKVKKNGYKNGSYNPASKQISWEIGLNYNSKPLQNAVLTDVIQSNQQMEKSSIKVYALTISENGTPQQGNELSSTLYKVEYDESSKLLKISFNNPISTPYLVKFTTSLKGQLTEDKTISNTAKLLDGTKAVSKDLTATVTIPYGGEYAEKSGVRSGSKVNWTIHINRNQSYVQNAVITDESSSNLMLLPSSFHLYNTLREELVKDKDYSLAITTDEVSGKQTFVLKFHKAIEEVYVLEYQTLFAVEKEGEEVTNTVEFTGDGVKKDVIKTSKVIINGISGGSGTGSGVRSTLSVLKVDDQDDKKLLAGATFVLYRLSSSGRDEVETVITDATGTAKFSNLWSGNYVLVETAAPKGYILDKTERQVTLNSTTVYTVKNKSVVVPTATPVSPTPVPTVSPTPVPTVSPTPVPTVSPTPVPTVSPTPVPTVSPTPVPTVSPTPVPTATPTPVPTVSPTPVPTATPTSVPTATPTPVPTVAPTPVPTATPTPVPTAIPTPVPTATPTPVPTVAPTPVPDPYYPTWPTVTPSTVPGVVGTPAPSATPEVTTTPSVAPVPSATPVPPIASSTPAVPQNTTPPVQPTETVTTVEEVPIEGEIPLGGIPSIGDQPSNGKVILTPDGKWVYTPNPGFTGKDQFTIVVTDEDGNEEEVLIEIDVEEVPKGTVTDTPEGDGLPAAVLPKTGEESAWLIYLSGAALIILGLVLSRRFKRSDSSK